MAHVVRDHPEYAASMVVEYVGLSYTADLKVSLTLSVFCLRGLADVDLGTREHRVRRATVLLKVRLVAWVTTSEANLSISCNANDGQPARNCIKGALAAVPLLLHLQPGALEARELPPNRCLPTRPPRSTETFRT
jgi:hypothetical protein